MNFSEVPQTLLWEVTAIYAVVSFLVGGGASIISARIKGMNKIRSFVVGGLISTTVPSIFFLLYDLWDRPFAMWHVLILLGFPIVPSLVLLLLPRRM